MPVTLQMWEKAQRRIAELKAKSTDLEQRAIRAASENALLIKKVKDLETDKACLQDALDIERLSTRSAAERIAELEEENTNLAVVADDCLRQRNRVKNLTIALRRLSCHSAKIENYLDLCAVDDDPDVVHRWRMAVELAEAELEVDN